MRQLRNLSIPILVRAFRRSSAAQRLPAGPLQESTRAARGQRHSEPQWHARCACRSRRADRRISLGERKCPLAAGHRQVDVGKDARIEQCTVQLARRIVDVVALAQRLQAVALSGMQLARQRESIEHLTRHADLTRIPG
jgi:hypothetical protein